MLPGENWETVGIPASLLQALIVRVKVELVLTKQGFVGAVPSFSPFSVFIACLILTARTFDNLQSGRANYCYLPFSELSRVVQCVLEKLTTVAPERKGNRICSRFFRDLLESMTNTFCTERGCWQFWKKLTSHFLRSRFLYDLCHFPEEFVSTSLSTVSALSLVAQGLSSFCPEFS